MSSARAIRPPALDLGLAGLLLVAAIAETAAGTPAVAPQALIGAIAVSGSLALRRVAPMAMALVSAAAVLLLPRADGVLWLLAAVLLLAFSVGLHLPPGRAAVALAILLVPAVVLQSRTASMPAALITPLVLLGGPGVVGAVLAGTRRQGLRLVLMTQRLREERDAQHRFVAEAERSRVSRDLHDILAHTLSTIVVQAAAATQLLAPEAPGSVPMDAAAEAGRAALTEVRALLALARSTPPTAPDPSEQADAIPSAGPRHWAAAAGIAVAVVGLVLVAWSTPGGTPIWVFPLVLLLAFAPFALLPLRPAAAALAAVVVAMALAPNDQPTLVGRIVSVAVLVGAPAIAGFLVGRARSRARTLRLLGERLVAERERSAVLVAQAERARIARELHDVLAHTLSSIAVQAGAAQQLVPADAAGRGPVDAVAQSARTALAEVRGLLADEDPERAPVAPTPSLERVPELVAAAGAVLVEHGEPSLIDAEVSLAAYRLVQESLTNARRHAAGHPPTVTLTWEADLLHIRVENDGPRAGRAEGGHGLLGMQERVRACGGTLQVGPREDGTGWLVDATLPLARVLA